MFKLSKDKSDVKMNIDKYIFRDNGSLAYLISANFSKFDPRTLFYFKLKFSVKK